MAAPACCTTRRNRILCKVLPPDAGAGAANTCCCYLQLRMSGMSRYMDTCCHGPGFCRKLLHLGPTSGC
eukprot:2530567-Ditylum_brightwellii.AAC.1